MWSIELWANAAFPIDSTLFGMVSWVMPLLEKALAPIVFNEDGKVSEEILHPQNASSPMAVIPSGNDRDVSFVCK